MFKYQILTFKKSNCRIQINLRKINLNYLDKNQNKWSPQEDYKVKQKLFAQLKNIYSNTPK